MNSPYQEILKQDKNFPKHAKSVKLIHVSDSTPGIERVRKGKGFAYYYNSERVTDKEELQRIKNLVIPPAWTNVWICPRPNGHLQVTGYDTKGRKQYKYHALWSKIRNETKFHRLYEFGKTLPQLRARLQEDIRKRHLTREKVLAIVISLMEQTYIRVGNEGYEKLYGSYGITTFKNNHVKVEGPKVRFSFKGKKGKSQIVTLKSRRLARAVKQCRDLPGRELFQYYDHEGDRHVVDSGMVNDYIKESTMADFTAKDFRTWAGTLNMLKSLKSVHCTDQSINKKLLLALDEVSRKLGNSRAICRKYYVHPGLIKMYEDCILDKYLEQFDAAEENSGISGLTCEEEILLKILKKLLP